MRIFRPLQSGVCAAPYDMLFCGTDRFACAALEALLAPALVRSVRVLTPPDVKHAWGASRMRVSPVKQLAQQRGIDALEVPAGGLEALELPRAVRESPAPLLVTASFGHLVPRALLAQFRSPSHTLNLHPSLLPALRGAAPIQWAIARQLATTGVSVQQLSVDAFDRGAILGQEEVRIPDGADYAALERLLAQRGADLLARVVADLPGAHARRREQDDAQRTSAPKLHARHAHIRWGAWSAATIDARLRAFAHALPLTTTLVPRKDGFRAADVLVRSAHAAAAGGEPDELRDAAPGEATYVPALAAVAARCGHGTLLITRLQTRGKPVRGAAEWWRGFRDRADARGMVQFSELGE